MKSSVKTTFSTHQLTYIAVLTAVLCIIGPFTIPLPFSPIPLSLISLVIYLSVFLFGQKVGTLSYLLYFLIGLAGVPVFSGFAGGFAKAAGPTGGYLLGFLFLTLIMGYFTEKFPARPAFTVIGMTLGTAVCYLFGTLWLSWQMSIPFIAGLSLGVLPYLPGDICKMILVMLLGPKLKKTLAPVLK